MKGMYGTLHCIFLKKMTIITLHLKELITLVIKRQRMFAHLHSIIFFLAFVLKNQSQTISLGFF